MPRPLHPEVRPLRDVGRALARELALVDSSSAPEGLPASQLRALGELERGRLNQRALAGRLGLDTSTTSRLVQRLVDAGWVRADRDAGDHRSATLALTRAGVAVTRRLGDRADAHVQLALHPLTPAQRARLLEGIQLYARALARARARRSFRLRRIRPGDEGAVKRILRTVMPKLGARGPGFAINDPEVSCMHRAYRRRGCAYFVVEGPEGVVGGGGIAPLTGGDERTCELRKMYFLPLARGLGLGQALMDRCLAQARALGYRRCYLETLQAMSGARALYLRNGFRPLKKPQGDTGHFGCDAWYARSL